MIPEIELMQKATAEYVENIPKDYNVIFIHAIDGETGDTKLEYYYILSSDTFSSGRKQWINNAVPLNSATVSNEINDWVRKIERRKHYEIPYVVFANEFSAREKSKTYHQKKSMKGYHISVPKLNFKNMI